MIGGDFPWNSCSRIIFSIDLLGRVDGRRKDPNTSGRPRSQWSRISLDYARVFTGEALARVALLGPCLEDYTERALFLAGASRNCSRTEPSDSFLV